MFISYFRVYRPLTPTYVRNIQRFPEDFMFQLTKDECLTSQIVTLNESRGHLPVVAKFAIVQKEGNRIVTRYVEYYNLDVIISVGYHIGASLKDLGKKLFAFSKMEVMTGSELLAGL